MKQLIAYSLIACSALFGASRNDDLKYIVERTFLEPQVDPLLNMMATEAIAETGKKIDSDVLVQDFRKSFTEEKTLAKFFAPYQTVFSDEEIAELRKIQENPVSQKYSHEAMPIFQSQLQALKETFKELAANFVVEEKKEEAIPSAETAEVAENAEVWQLTQENFDEVTQSSLPVIIEIHASWCHACRMMDPVFEEMSQKYQGTIQFAQVDIDAEHELAKKYDVTSLPTLVFIKPGQKTPVMKSVGFIGKKDFEAKIQAFLKK